MKWLLFTDGKGKEYRLNEHLATYILSLLDPQSRFKASRVCHGWKEILEQTERYIELLPTIRSIPMFSTVTLDVLRLKLMAGGMTNATYRLALGPDRVKRLPPELVQAKPELKRPRWVVRFPGDVSLFAVNRANEGHNALQASELGLNVPIAYFDKSSGIQVTQFIEGVCPFDEKLLERADVLKTLAAKAKLLHHSDKFLNETHVFERNEELFASLKAKGFALPADVSVIETKMSDLKQLFATFKIEIRPCHNDLTALNYMFSLEGTPKREVVRLIDWEYSSNNDFIWDLSYFAIEAKLTKEQEHIFLSAYFESDEVDESIRAWYTTYKLVVQWWITLWSWTQLAAGANSVDPAQYKALGQERYEKCLGLLASNEYAEAVTLIEGSIDSSMELTPRSF